MANNIVSGLFGLSPYETQQQQNQQADNAALQYAKLDPVQRAMYSYGKAGTGLAQAGAGMLGIQNSAMAEAEARQAALSGLDMSSPESIMQRAQQITDPRLKMQLQMLAQQKMAERQKLQAEAAKTALAERKQDFTEKEAFELKKMEAEARIRQNDQRIADARTTAQERMELMRENNQIKMLLGQMMNQTKRDAAESKKQGDVDKEKKASIATLKSAGYDPETGQDEISELIKQSTSGGFQKLGAGVAEVFGQSTTGNQAIQTLATRANRMTLALMGGKLGAGISNADREFILAQLGGIADSSKSAETRLAAWNDVIKVLRREGEIPEPKVKETPTPASTPNNGWAIRPKGQ
jgi:hypothetical protein